jgi:lysyl-tRNA synthetase class 2
MPSTVIRSFSYDPARAELLIEFQSGRQYVYCDVPEEIYTAMKAAFAKGEFFNSRVRDHYPFRRIEVKQGEG